MLRHPLTHSWVPVPEAKSNSGRWFRSASGGLGRKSVVVGARCPSCTTTVTPLCACAKGPAL